MAIIGRRQFISALGSAAATWPLSARAQTLPVIGVLGSASAAAYSERLSLIWQALAEAGFTEGHTVATEYRWAESQLDRLPALAADLVGRRVKVIIATGGLQAVRAAMSATSTTPIVFSTDGDPVKQGLVSSLNRPGGNATGITVFSASLMAKRLDVFRELVPQTKVFGVLVNPAAAQAQEQIQDAEEAGGSLGFEIRVLNARSDAEFEPALTAFDGMRDAALLVSADPIFIARRETLVAVVNRHAIPAIYGRRDFAAAGGLVSYGARLDESYRLMGTYVGRILKGEKPADLPVQQPTKFEFVINMKTAKALGLTFPAGLLAIADEVIE
jgi:putative tryptophan/tyrosine transport system substrate-binding protein